MCMPSSEYTYLHIFMKKENNNRSEEKKKVKATE